MTNTDNPENARHEKPKTGIKTCGKENAKLLFNEIFPVLTLISYFSRKGGVPKRIKEKGSSDKKTDITIIMCSV